jgi:hypothetical protein
MQWQRAPLSAPPKWGWTVEAKEVQSNTQNTMVYYRKERIQAIFRREIATLSSAAMVMQQI